MTLLFTVRAKVYQQKVSCWEKIKRWTRHPGVLSLTIIQPSVRRVGGAIPRRSATYFFDSKSRPHQWLSNVLRGRSARGEILEGRANLCGSLCVPPRFECRTLYTGGMRLIVVGDGSFPFVRKHFSRACFYGFFYKEERRGGEVFGSFITVLLVYLDSHVNRIITRVARFAEPCIRLWFFSFTARLPAVLIICACKHRGTLIITRAHFTIFICRIVI